MAAIGPPPDWYQLDTDACLTALDADLGRKLEPLGEDERVDSNLLDGCQSRVWLVMDGDAQALNIRANSDAAIVSGLIALLIRVYDGAPPADILASEPAFVEAIGLSQHLSPTRANGLGAMLAAIHQKASDLSNAGSRL